MQDEMVVTVIATGFEGMNGEKKPPLDIDLDDDYLGPVSAQNDTANNINSRSSMGGSVGSASIRTAPAITGTPTRWTLRLLTTTTPSRI